MTRGWGLACAAACALAVALTLHATSALERIEELTIDARFALRDRHDPPDDVVVVGVDERTLAELGTLRWPYPRDVQALVLDRLRALRPRLIVYDLSITEGTDRDADLALFDAIRRARPVVMGTAEGGQRVLGGPANVKAAHAVVASALLPQGSDGVVREVEGAPRGVPSIAVATARLVGRGTPLRARQRTWIDWAGPPGTVRAVSYADVRKRRAPAAAVRGRIAVVGLTAPRLQDVKPTAIGERDMSGPEIHANAIATVLHGTPLESAAAAVDAALVAALALLIPGLALLLGTRALLAAPVAAAALAGGAQAAFAGGTVIAVATPGAGLLAGTAGAGAALLATEVRDRRRLRATFARFVPEDIVDVLAQRADGGAGLPAEELDATVVFCDLRGFTTYAEDRAAVDVIATLNRYLSLVADAILGHGGTVVAYMGDGVMAVFGAPLARDDHADRALAAAREIIGPRLQALNAWLAVRGDEHRFTLGVGMHSGPVMSGTVGSARRLEYAAVGDTTNVAARVQALTGERGGPILLTTATHERLAGADGLRPVGEAALRGRERPVELWEAGG